MNWINWMIVSKLVIAYIGTYIWVMWPVTMVWLTTWHNTYTHETYNNNLNNLIHAQTYSNKYNTIRAVIAIHMVTVSDHNSWSTNCLIVRNHIKGRYQLYNIYACSDWTLRNQSFSLCRSHQDHCCLLFLQFCQTFPDQAEWREGVCVHVRPNSQIGSIGGDHQAMHFWFLNSRLAHLIPRNFKA